jgi:hypothetical protein
LTFKIFCANIKQEKLSIISPDFQIVFSCLFSILIENNLLTVAHP